MSRQKEASPAASSDCAGGKYSATTTSAATRGQAAGATATTNQEPAPTEQKPPRQHQSILSLTQQPGSRRQSPRQPRNLRMVAVNTPPQDHHSGRWKRTTQVPAGLPRSLPTPKPHTIRQRRNSFWKALRTTCAASNDSCPTTSRLMSRRSATSWRSRARQSRIVILCAPTFSSR